MSAYQGHQYGDGQMPSNASNHGAYHAQYHPQEPMMHAPVGNGVNNVMSAQMAEEAAYYNMMNAPHAGDYAAGGFMPLPQAPRLPVAAARATSMAAMYYDPTLHPQHAYSNNVSAPAPWAVPYYNPANGHAMGEYNPSAPFQHQHVEHQMMLHNQMSRSHQHPPQQQVDPHTYGSGVYSNPAQPITADPSHLAAGNHLDSNFAHNPHVSSASYYGGLNAATASAAPQQFYDWEQQFAGGTDEYDPANAAAYHRNATNDPRRNLSSAGIRSEMTGSYGMPHGQGGEGVYGDYRNVHALDQPYHPANPAAGWPSTTSYPGNGQWQDVSHRSHRQSMPHPHQRHHQPPPPPSSSHGGNAMWSRKGMQTNEPAWTGHESSFPITSSQAQQNPQFVSEAQNWHHARPDQGYAPQQHQMHPIQGQFNADVTAAPHAQFPPMDQNAIGPANNAPMQDAEAQKAPPAPAPPSPDTLDKSAVPVSSVGAEIIWVAAAALLDPSMWVRASLNINASNRNRIRSSGSMSETSSNPSPFTSPLTDSHDNWEQAMDMSTQDTDVSKASSSQQSTHRKNVKSSDLYDESSASSSEPGTPPTSIPSRIWEKDGRHEKQNSLGALHGMRSLELSNDSRSSHRSVSPMDVQSPSQRSTFQRSASYDRAREAVVSITDLLDRDWRWSLNDDKLESLAQSQRPEAHQKLSNGRRSSSSSRREDNSTHGGGASMPGTEPSPAFRRFAHQVLAQTLVSPTAFMLSLMYSLRVLHLAIQTRSGKPSLDPEAAEIFAQPPSAAPFKLFTLGLMIANKHLDDNTFLNKTWNEVTGISLAELNRAERWYLEKSSYEITVPEETWVSFLKQLHLRTEHKISLLASAKRIRVPTKQAPDSLRRQDSYVVPHAGSEEAQKRFLLGIEDALQALGYDNVFDLAANSVQGSREETNLHHCAPKPKESLRHLHQNHHSAPAVDLMRISKHANQEGEFDVFEDENGPYRPHSASIRRLTANEADGKDMIKKRSSQANLGGEAVLSRSVSDGITPTISCAHEQQRIQSKRESKTEMHAPLAPSVLLDLLNRGQHLAHAAH